MPKFNLLRSYTVVESHEVEAKNEDEGPQKETCPHCNNADMEQTVYMMPQDLEIERMLSEVFEKVFWKESGV